MYFYSDDPAMDLIRYQDSCRPARVRKPRCKKCECKLGDHCFEGEKYDDYFCEDCFKDLFEVKIQEPCICANPYCGEVIEDVAYRIEGELWCKECAYDACKMYTPEFED